MKIVVCVKQVPDSTNVRINPETNTLMREGVESIVNPFDEYALEMALRIRDEDARRETRDAQGNETRDAKCKVIVISMGPPQATAVLRASLARGADEAFLVSSRAFGGADTLATSYTLAQAILKACGGEKPDLVLFGKQAIDGDTAQVGPGVSEYLDLPLVTYVREVEVEKVGGGGDAGGGGAAFTATTIMDDGEHVIKGSLPAVMTVVKDAAEPRFASLAGTMAAAKAPIAVFDEKAIAADPIRIGLKGSPTKVVTIFPPPVKGGGRKIDWTGDAAALAKTIREAIHG